MRQILLVIATLGLFNAQASSPASAFQASSKAQAVEAPVNLYGLTAAMLAPCDEWLSIRSPAYRGGSATLNFSNLDYALSDAPYANTDFVDDIEYIRENIRGHEEVVRIMEQRDRVGMRNVIGRVYEGLDYYDRLRGDEQYLCMLYVRQQQLTGGPFRRVFRTPASLGITPEIIEALRRQPSGG